MKRKSRKRIALFQVAVLLILSVSTNQNSVRAAENAKIYAEDATGAQGEEIQIPVKISGNTGIMGFQISVNYDENYLTPVSTLCGDVLSGVFDDNISVSKDSFFDVLWSGTENSNKDGILFYLKFRIKETAPKGTTKIGLTYSQEDTFDEAYKDVVLDCSDINFTIDGEPLTTLEPTAVPTNTPDPANSYVVNAEEVKAKSGDEISVPVNISKNAGIAGFIMTVSYDADLLSPLSVKAGEVIPGGTTFDDNCTTAQEAKFKILWSGTENIYTDGCLFTLNFKVKDNLSETTTKLDISYLENETFDEDYNNVSLQCNSVSVHVLKNAEDTPVPTVTPTLVPAETERPTATPTAIPEVTPTQTPILTEENNVYATSIDAAQGEEVTLPVRISGNSGMMGLGIKIAYDKDVLTPVSVARGEILNNGYFDDNIGIHEDETFEILWSGTDEIYDNGILFEITFSVSEYVGNGETEIAIEYLPEDTFDEAYQDVVVNCNNAKLNIKGVQKATPTPSPTPEATPTIPAGYSYAVYAETVEGIAGENVSIPVMINNNHGLIGFLMTVKYDANILEPISVAKGEVLPDGTTFDDTCTTPIGDSFKILWAGTDEISVNGCLYTLNFKVKDDVAPGKTSIELSYKQSDTFDGEYRGVELNCKEICVDVVERPTKTPVPTPIATHTMKPTATPSGLNKGTISTPKLNISSIQAKKITYSKPAKVKIQQVKAKRKNQIYVKWKKQNKIGGYQIQYATNKKFKKKKVKNLKSSKNKITLKKLKPKKYYYIRVRSYKKYGSKKVYGKWSKVKKCKTK